MAFRTEKDSFGEVQIPKEAYYGAQTGRSLVHFQIGEEQFPKAFIHAYALVKQAAAKANVELGALDGTVGQWIEQACKDIQQGLLDKEFPLSVWQTGSGTQTNMNLNEVIANRAAELADETFQNQKRIHPNDHVNCGQSTNDTFPTAMHVCVALLIHHRLLPSIAGLEKTLQDKAASYRHVVKMGRTHLQDATPLTLGQEISGWEAQLQESKALLLSTMPFVYQLAAGGTAVGTGINTHPQYAERIAMHLKEMTELPFVTAPNKFAALAGHEALVALSGALCSLGTSLMKIANDVRWMASGPRGGLGEITIAENEPGSSIMPGKVNPTQCEALTMVCCQVFGNHTTITLAASQGNFELNVFKPVILYNAVQSIRLLSDCIQSFDKYCAQSIFPNLKRLEELKSKSLMLVTALAPKLGYDKAAQIAKKAHYEDKTLKEVVLELGLMPETEFDDLVQPEKMITPGKHA